VESGGLYTAKNEGFFGAAAILDHMTLKLGHKVMQKKFLGKV
jgi:hypothetical protein